MFKNPTFFKRPTVDPICLKDKFTELPLDSLIQEGNYIKTFSPSKNLDFNASLRDKQLNFAIQLFSKADQVPNRLKLKNQSSEKIVGFSISKDRKILFPTKVIQNKDVSWKHSNILSSYILPCHIEKLYNWLEYSTERKPFDFEELVNSMTNKTEIKKLKPNRMSLGTDIVPEYLLKRTKKSNSKSSNNNTQKLTNIAQSIIKAYKAHGSRSNDDLNVTFVGSSKSGKSTLIGNIIVQLGVFSETFIQKTEWSATKANAAESKMAWLLDTSNNERNFRETILSSSSYVEINGKSVNINDTPGNFCYFDQIIKSLLVSNQVILVINLRNDWCDETQTFINLDYLRNILYIFKVLNVDKLSLVFVNSSGRDIVKPFANFASMWKRFFKTTLTHLSVDNLADLQSSEIQSIVELISNFPRKPVELELEKPLLVDIVDIYKPVESALPVCVGRVLRGGISSGVNNALSACVVIPEKLSCTVKSMKIHEKGEMKTRSFAFSHDLVEFTFPEINSDDNIVRGTVICHPNFPLTSSSKFIAEIRIFDWDIDVPIMNGINVLLWSKSRTCFCQLTKILSSKYYSKKQMITEKFPRLVQRSGSTITARITTEEVLVVELGSQDKYDTFFLFCKLKLFAAGKIVNIPH